MDVLKWLGYQRIPQIKTTGVPKVSTRARQTTSVKNQSLLGIPFGIVSQADQNARWRRLNLDSQTLSRMTAEEIIELMIDVSPEISMAVWQFLRFYNPGWELQALNSVGEIDTQAQSALDEMIKIFDKHYGSFGIQLNRLAMNAFVRGGVFAEIVLDENGRNVIDFVVPDAWTLQFRQILTPERGLIWQYGQPVSGTFKSMNDIDTIQYIPIDPYPGRPYGRPPISPAIWSGIFLIGLMHDLRRVISAQGYPRVFISIDMEKLRALMPGDLEGNPEATQSWVNAIITEVTSAINVLEPDETFVHTDILTPSSPIGTLGGDLSSIDDITRLLERQLIRALKTQPIFLNSNEAVAETHAKLQLKIYAATIETFQHNSEILLENLFRAGLQAQGFSPDIVRFRFAKLNIADELADAQVENLKIQNELAKYNAGWVSQDVASLSITGSEADMPKPRLQMPLPSQGRSEAKIENLTESKRAVQLSPSGSETPLPPEPVDDTAEPEDLDTFIKTWNKLMPEYKDLLLADIEATKSSRVSLLLIPTIWVWNVVKRWYKKRGTKKIINQTEGTFIRDDFIRKGKLEIEGLSKRLASGELTIQRWLLEMRDEIKKYNTLQYTYGRGGKNVMTPTDYENLTKIINDQYGFLQRFAEGVKEGKFSQAQISARANQYIEATGSAFEQGRAAAFSLSLPEYPGDGKQICKANCKCEWVIKEFPDRYEATWKLEPGAEHCETCLENSSKWKPLVIKKR